jgi:hypothetical protein
MARQRSIGSGSALRILALGFALALVAPVAARGPVLFFEQPALKDVGGHVYVVAKPPKNTFFLVLWQPNPHRPDGGLVAVTWPVGDKTGFYPAGPLAERQRGMRDAYGSTALQIEGDTVAAYLNSEDLIRGSKDQKEMITPAYEFAEGTRVRPFAGDNGGLTCSLQLQVPVARDGGKPGSSAYINLNLLFGSDGGILRVSYNGGLYFHGRAGSPETIGYDPVTRNVLVITPIRPGSRWSSYASGSAVRQGAPWKGWKTFQFKITRTNFRAALGAVKQKYPEVPWSDNTAAWTLNQVHLNAELRYRTAPAELGWSMRRLRCSVDPEFEGAREGGDSAVSAEVRTPEEQQPAYAR